MTGFGPYQQNSNSTLPLLQRRCQRRTTVTVSRIRIVRILKRRIITMDAYNALQNLT